MNLVSANGISRTESGRLLFKNASFGIDDDSRIAIIGRNGTGKTTLMKIIAGIKEPEDGLVTKNRELKIAFLEQTPSFAPGEKIADFILAGDSEEIKTVRDYEKAVSSANVDTEVVTTLVEKMESLGCWTLEQRIQSLLSELGINDLGLDMSSLSGGMIKKTALARTLVSDADLIILDEPTNHLDIETIDWLEQFLAKAGKAVLLVTHDRYFMDKVCNSVIELDEQQVFVYEGNYSSYLSQKAMRETVKNKTADRLNNILRNEAEWIKRGPRARAGKDKKRKARFFEMMNERPEPKAVSDSFSVEGKRLGGKILEIEGVSKAYEGKVLFEDFTFSFRKGDKVGIIGANGSGKTSLLNIVTGRTQPDSGSVEYGVNTKIAYYDQMSKELPLGEKVGDYIKDTAEIIKLRDGSTISPSQFLERFLFPSNLMYTEIGNLSGGERKKLHLLKLLLENPNFLVFDEPTNDFDIQTLSILEDFLSNFAGCAVVVSHDRFFLDRTVDFLIVIDEHGKLQGFSGSASEYYEFKKDVTADLKQEEKKNELPDKKVSGWKDNRDKKKGLSFKEKQELSGIEDEILSLEDEKQQLENFFMSPDASAAESGEKKKRYDELLGIIEECYQRWEDLESRA
ncbi:MAG: ABC-F family ATP-binding cassette domain-containing protein [Spirochaetales bacterium]|nr:ABC-F family ATP-binding cassette domain-containing protein [Spirochaetales bacterium]